MSKRYQGGVLGVGFNPLQAPNAPTIGTATTLCASASVAFTAPANVGGSAITSYAVQSTPDGIGATGSSSPITVSGLTINTAYTFRVAALNSYGPSPYSAASNSVTPSGQNAYTTAGTFTWVAPAGVTSVSVVAVGAGGGGNGQNGGAGGGGGGLSYGNNISVTPGTGYSVVVGAGGVGRPYNDVNPATAGGNSSFGLCVTATGGEPIGGAGGTGTYAGGAGGASGGSGGGGGGGAGGYSGAGGAGSASTSSGTSTLAGGGGTGGAGGGGSGGSVNEGGSGGGVGILGEGASGSGGVGAAASTAGKGGGGGSGGSAGGNGIGSTAPNATAGLYGGGGAGARFGGNNGAVGAVRIIYPGTTRSFPSTNTGDL